MLTEILGHYLKVPPKTMFLGQLVATIWSCKLHLGAKYIYPT
jgi:hypothetical protein